MENELRVDMRIGQRQSHNLILFLVLSLLAIALLSSLVFGSFADAYVYFVGVANNATSASGVNSVVKFSANITGNGTLSYYRLTWNNSGSFINDTLHAYASELVSVNKTVTAVKNSYVCGYFWANDSNGNVNTSSQTCFTVSNTAPSQGTPFITPSPAYTNSNLTCNPFNVTDADNDAVQNITVWYKNGQPTMLLYLPFEGGSNSTWTKDYSGNNNNVFVDGATFVSTGRNGTGVYNFSGTKSMNLSSSNINISGNRPFTVTLWFKLFKQNVVNSVIFYIGDAISSASCNQAYKLNYDNANNRTVFSRCVNGSVASASNSATNSLRDDHNWHHIVASYNGTHTMIYTDGILSDSDYDIIPMTANVSAIYIGNQFVIRGVNASLDEIKVFNISLSAQQVLNNYQNENQNVPTNLLLDNSYNSSSVLCSITPNDGTSDGTETNSSSVPIYWRISSILVNLSRQQHIIQDIFYGANFHNKYLTCNASVYNDSSGHTNTTDCLWHQQKFFDTNLGFIRMDSSTQFANDDLTFSSYFDKQKDIVRLAYQNNLKILVNMYGIPDSMRNKTAECTSNNNSCLPTNLSRWADLTVNFIDHVTENGKYNATLWIAVWNEPNGGLLSSLASDHINQSIGYNEIFNFSYNKIKAKYPNMLIGGTSCFEDTRYCRNITKYFISNFTTKIDFFDWHEARFPSGGFTYGDDAMNSVLDRIIGNITGYGGNASRIVFSEYRVGDASYTNGSVSPNLYKMQLGLGFLAMLNRTPNNVSVIVYQWSSDYIWNGTNPPGYTYREEMVSEPQLDNSLYTGYNITKEVSLMCPPGATVYNTASSDGNVITVGCQKGRNGAVILINKGDYVINASVNFNSSAINTLSYYTDGTIVSKSADGLFYTGLMQPSDVKSWNYTDGTNTAPTTPTTSPASGNYSYRTITLSCSGSTDLDGDTVYYQFYTGSTTSPTTLRQNSTSTTYIWTLDNTSMNYWRCTASDQYGGTSGYTATQTEYTCGDSVITAGEQCDRLNMVLLYCSDYGTAYKAGTLTCANNCQYDVSQCTATITSSNQVCRNNVLGLQTFMDFIPLLIVAVFAGIALLFVFGLNIDTVVEYISHAELKSIAMITISVVFVAVIGLLILSSLC